MKSFCVFNVFLIAASISGLVPVKAAAQSQTPGQITQFDPNLNVVDSVITQDPSGNIGIGTASPAAALHVAAGDVYLGNVTNPAFAGNKSMYFENQGGDVQNSLRINAGAVGSPYDNLFLAGFSNPGSTRGTGIKFLTAPAGEGQFERMTIDPNGNVGIGTTAAISRLHVQNGVSGLPRFPTDGITGECSATACSGVSGVGQGYGVVGRTNDPFRAGVAAVSAGASDANLGLIVTGRFFASGTKNAVVSLEDGQRVLLTAEESTEVWFSDYGTAQLADGRAIVQIDPRYLQTVNTEKDYHVFLTARGNPTGSLYIDQETPLSFEIRESTGTANIRVSYRIVAKRKDFADERMKRVQNP